MPSPNAIAMDRLLPVVNKLHSIFQRCGLADPIDLPQIVVVGSQSSGKSSVLESIVGFDFLPRGSGVVTRSPILIQLNKLKGVQNLTSSDTLSGKKAKPERWVEFIHAPDKKFVEENEIQAEIVAETERVAGKNKSLSPTALIMKVFSKDVVDLTLIDLPGLTKVPVGDQPPDIEKLVRAMILSYIEKENTIILAVHPANTDLATSDALQMARRVDPHGMRTLGVITKLDLMDAGTNALDMLQSRVIPLRKGYIGVVNRSQADLDKNATVAESRVAERNFFQSHPVYAPHASKMGSQYLAELLSIMLMEHIRNVIPSTRSKLTSQLSEVRAEVATLGPELSGADDASGTLLHLLTKYASSYADAIDGRPRSPLTTTELSGGARISYIFHEKFGIELSQMDPFEALGTDEIRTAMRNATGHRTPLFIPESAFELLVRKQISRFLNPSLTCVDMVYDELTRLAEAVEGAELSRFHRLRLAVSEATLKLLREQKTPTTQMIHNLVEMEMGYINTWHPDFVGGRQALSTMIEKALMPNTTETNHIENSSTSSRSLRERHIQSRTDHPDAWVEKNLLGHTHTNRTGDFGRNTDHGANRRRPTPRGQSTIGRVPPSDGIVAAISRATAEGSSIPNHLRITKSEALNDDERQELDILRILLDSYFNIVRKRMQDMVPKAIITFLVQRSKDSLQSVLVSKLYKPKTIEKLMVEGEETTQRRKDMQAIETLLEKALVEVNEIRDVH